jgi:cathepsin F
MNKFLFALVLALVTCNLDLDSLIFQQFQRFITKYHKKYQSVNEYLARFEVFKKNVKATFNEVNIPYKTGITKFSDLTQQEFAKTYLNLNYDAMAMANFEPFTVKERNDAPDTLDWRDDGRVSAVKDQAQCGSCWAFATVGNLEGLYAANKGVMKTFSEQMLVDCDTSDSGCNGGLMQNTFNWIKRNGGIMYDSDYPYTGTDGSCKSDKSKYADFQVTGYKKLGSTWSTWSCVDEGQIKTFLYETGPLAIALNANFLSSYVSGVLDKTSSECPTSSINHGVTLIGYGNDSDSGLDYWLVKNSWGSDWGESGFFRIRRGNGTCGVNCYITTALVSF